MATIARRGKGFLARVRRRGFGLVTKTFTFKADAAAWARRVEADMEAGRWTAYGAPETMPTLAEAIEKYRNGPAQRLKGAAKYAYWFDELAACDLAERSLNAITARDLAAWRDAQMALHQPGTVVRKLGLLSGLFTWCQRERGWLSANPLRSITKPRVNDSRDRTMTADEQRYLLEAASTSRAPWLHDSLVVLLRSAMRRGELCTLNRSDIDFDRSIAHLADTKNGKARDVPLCPQALAAMQRLSDAAARRRDDALIPVADPHGVSLAFRRTLKRARRQYVRDCAANGRESEKGFLSNLRLHDLRHHAVTRWATTGALSTIELQAVSGHRSLRALSRYTHLSASALAGKLATLSQ